MPELRGSSYAQFRVTVRNQTALIANFHRLGEDAHARLVDLIDVWGEAIRDRAIEEAPIGKDTDPPPHPGFLKRNIEVRYTPGHLGFEVGCWAENFDAINENLYAIFQEWGTSQHEAHPFIGPAYEWGGPLVRQDVNKLLRELGRRYGGPGSG